MPPPVMGAGLPWPTSWVSAATTVSPHPRPKLCPPPTTAPAACHTTPCKMLKAARPAPTWCLLFLDIHVPRHPPPAFPPGQGEGSAPGGPPGFQGLWAPGHQHQKATCHADGGAGTRRRLVPADPAGGGFSPPAFPPTLFCHTAAIEVTSPRGELNDPLLMTRTAQGPTQAFWWQPGRPS